MELKQNPNEVRGHYFSLNGSETIQKITECSTLFYTLPQEDGELTRIVLPVTAICVGKGDVSYFYVRTLSSCSLIDYY